MGKIKITYRGWTGHFICGHRCLFRLNTLIEYGKKKIVVSTVGAMPDALQSRDKDGNRRFDTIGCDRHYETMAFYAHKSGGFWDANVSKEIYFDSPWSWSKIEDEPKAQKGHEKVVAELANKLKQGKF